MPRLRPVLQGSLAALAVAVLAPPAGLFGYVLLERLLMTRDARGIPVESTWLAAPVILGAITVFSGIAGYAWSSTTGAVRPRHAAASGLLAAVLMASAWFGKEAARGYAPSALHVAQGLGTLSLPAVLGMLLGRAVAARWEQFQEPRQP